MAVQVEALAEVKAVGRVQDAWEDRKQLVQAATASAQSAATKSNTWQENLAMSKNARSAAQPWFGNNRSEHENHHHSKRQYDR